MKTSLIWATLPSSCTASLTPEYFSSNRAGELVPFEFTDAFFDVLSEHEVQEDLLVGGVLGEALERAAGTGEEAAGARGHLFMAIDPAAFGDPEKALAGVNSYLDEIRASRKAPNIDKILIPGERSFDDRRRNLKEGVPILDEVWNRTVELAAGLGVEIPNID